MRAFIVLISLVGTALSTPVYDDDLETFDKKFNILEPQADQTGAAKRLKEAEEQINAQNEAFDKGESHFREKLTPFADMPKEDFERLKEGMKMVVERKRSMGMVMPSEEERSNPVNEARVAATYKKLMMRDTPDSFDAQASGWVTSVKNQGSCGSCVAFASHGLFETTMAKVGASTDGMDLSEQYLVDCAYNGNSANGCDGAWPNAYADWFAADGGLSPHENNYPYLEANPLLNCDTASTVEKWNPGYKISSASYDYSCTEDKMKELVASNGAVLTGVYASDTSFGNYASGVYDGCSSESANHAVLVVGYGTEDGMDYWLVKNSWGDSWGDSGYIKIARGSSQCEIGNVCVWTEAEANGTADEVPETTDETTDATTDDAMWCDLSETFTNAGYGSVTGGPYSLRFWVRGEGVYYSYVNCVDSMCTPAVDGVDNACQYICGSDTC